MPIWTYPVISAFVTAGGWAKWVTKRKGWNSGQKWDKEAAHWECDTHRYQIKLYKLFPKSTQHRKALGQPRENGNKTDKPSKIGRGGKTSAKKVAEVMNGWLNVNSILCVCRFNINYEGWKKRRWWKKYIKSNQLRPKKISKRSQLPENEIDEKIRGANLDFTHYKLNGTSLFGLCIKKTITLSKGNIQVLKKNYTLKKEQTEEALHKSTSLGTKLFPSFLRTFWDILNITTDFNRRWIIFIHKTPSRSSLDTNWLKYLKIETKLMKMSE